MPLKQQYRRFATVCTALALAIPLAVAGAAGSFAAAGPWAQNDQASVRLISAGTTTGDSDEVQLGLHFRLSAGWKIYWRSPGDAGLPPTLDWSRSENLAGSEQSWPVPHRFSLFGLETFGYGDEVVFPITAKLERQGETLKLRAALNYLVCAEICIPHDEELSLDLPAGPDSRAPEGFLIDSYAAMVPDDGARAGWTLERMTLAGQMDAPTIEVAARSDTAFQAPDLLLEGPPGFTFGKPEVILSEDGRAAVLRSVIGKTSLAQGVAEGKRFTVTVTDGTQGIELDYVARFNPSAAGGFGSGFNLLTLLPILALAFLGGLILNLMPCVLPVLSIKLLSVVEHGGRDRREVRAGFLASAAGIIVSFLVLAAVAVALKSAGASVGWGIQFQQPLFLTAITLVVTLFAFNLMGFFEIGLPSRLMTVLGRPMPQGEAQATGVLSLARHFGSGAFATLLATPCSAPFLGTAVSFALARGAYEIFLIFAMLGVGLAAPFLAVAVLPGLASRLPKPGHWMVTLRRVLGLALFATAAWLLTVLAGQIGNAAATATTALLVLLGAMLWFGRTPSRSGSVATAAAVLLAVGVFALPLGFSGEPALRKVEDSWRPLDQPAIAAMVERGNLIFVDVTADWCITCQVNKKLVLHSSEVLDVLERDSTVAMRGDWTLPDESITAYLASFNRYGIPFNAVYGPGAPAGIALPELLTIGAVLEAVERAGGDDGARLAEQSTLEGNR